MNHKKGMNKSSQPITFLNPVFSKRIILSSEAFFLAIHNTLNQVNMANQAIPHALL